ncbi:MAG: fumarylacetoacetate hydrolase family protein [Anaerolineales bacterium]|nr:fumarylacetoacetate hydrolase family protein [Anaerolineales bacterium]
MFLVRYQKDNAAHYGHLEGETIGAITGDVFGDFARGGPVAQLAEVVLLPPCAPSKIIALSVNFADRLRELGLAAPELPAISLMAPSALLGAHQPIRLPAHAREVLPGAELAVVIGRAGRWISPEEARAHILGYTCANALSALDIAEVDQSWTRASNFDTFLPLGPAIATHVDPTELVVGCSVNGVPRQMATTHDMLFTVEQVIAFVSAAMTLNAGDLILMGTPAGGQPLAPGDVVEVQIEGIGALRNPVVREA